MRQGRVAADARTRAREGAARRGALGPAGAETDVFSGIVECTCPVRAVSELSGARRLVLDLAALRGGDGRGSDPGHALSIEDAGLVERPWVRLGSSVAVNGCCLTVAELRGDATAFDVVSETLQRTGLGALQPGDRVNVERSLRYGDAVDGHLVSGHIEGQGEVIDLRRTSGDVRLSVHCSRDIAGQLLPKGSVAIDGVSLTLAALEAEAFTVALVPHTLSVTTMGSLRAGDRVNLEPDLLGRWVLAAVARERGQP